MKQKIEVIFPYSEEAKNNLKLCEYAEELGIKLNGSYYPKIECGYFVINKKYWHDVQEEWDWFCDKLLSYKPLDYNDYKSITEEFNAKLKEKIAKTEIEEKKKQIEKLQKELNTVN